MSTPPTRFPASASIDPSDGAELHFWRTPTGFQQSDSPSLRVNNHLASHQRNDRHEDPSNATFDSEWSNNLSSGSCCDATNKPILSRSKARNWRFEVVLDALRRRNKTPGKKASRSLFREHKRKSAKRTASISLQVPSAQLSISRQHPGGFSFHAQRCSDSMSRRKRAACVNKSVRRVRLIGRMCAAAHTFAMEESSAKMMCQLM